MRYLGLTLIIIASALLLGCSSGADLPSAPREDVNHSASSTSSHYTWGLFRFEADLDAGTLDVTPLRSAEMHLNALPFLEPPPFVNLSLESLEINGNLIEADIGLRHPFLGMNEFTGMDVNGILISNGTIGGFTDSGITIPGPDDIRLLNADGSSRWWNPTEFPVNAGIFAYNDGVLGTPDSIADFNSTVNPYKYYCGDFNSPDDPMSEVDPEGRGVFRAGEKNVRRYSIEMGASGLVFNYAVDANWEFPAGDPPWVVPDSFGPAANRPEPWWIDTEVSNNTLFNDGTVSGGGFNLTMNVYDWYNAEMNTVDVESPGNFAGVFDIAPDGGGAGYSAYYVEITSVTPAYGEIPVLITAKCEETGFGGLLPGKSTAAYKVLYLPVSPESEPLQAVATATIEPYFDGFGPEGTSDDPVPTEWYLTLDASESTGNITEYLWEMNGDDLFDEASGMVVSAGFPDTGTHVIKLKVSDGSGENILQLSGSYEVVQGTYVWDAFSGISDGSRATPYTTILDATTAVGQDGYILVRGDNGTGGQCTYSDLLYLTSDNQGTRIQGYYGDYDTDEPPNFTGYVVAEGQDITFDGFEATGTAYYTFPQFNNRAKLAMYNSDNALFRHIYVHDVPAPCRIFWCFEYGGTPPDGTMTVQNCLEVPLDTQYHIKNGCHDDYVTPGPTIEILNSTFDRLSNSTDNLGLYVSGLSNLTIRSCIWTDVVGANVSMAGGYIRSIGVIKDVDYNCASDTPAPPDGGTLYSNITPGIHCTTLNPLYVDPYSDHHLQTGSPCIDSGDTTYCGNDTDGSMNDMGCYGGPYGDWNFED